MGKAGVGAVLSFKRNCVSVRLVFQPDLTRLENTTQMSTSAESNLEPDVHVQLLDCDDFPWCRMIRAKVSISRSTLYAARHCLYMCFLTQISMGNDLKAGRIVAHSISRHSLSSSRESFHRHLDDFSEDANEMGLALFDRYGRLRQQASGAMWDKLASSRLLHHQSDGLPSLRPR